MTHPRQVLSAAITALTFGACAGTAAASGEITDLRWDPAESGWGDSPSRGTGMRAIPPALRGANFAFRREPMAGACGRR